MKNQPPSDFLSPCIKSAHGNTAQTVNDTTRQAANAKLQMLIELAHADISSPLVRKAQAYPRFAIGASTFLKKVAAGELPQPAYRDGRVTAYRTVDLDMMLAAQTLAERYGFVLNARAFVAALSAPATVSVETLA